MVLCEGLCSTTALFPSSIFSIKSGSRSYLTMEIISCAMGANRREPLTEAFFHTLRGLRSTTLLMEDMGCSVPTLCLYVSKAAAALKITRTTLRKWL